MSTIPAGQGRYEPGNGTSYWIVYGTDENGTPFVALPDFRTAATMAWASYMHPSYAGEKLGLGYADAGAVAEFLNSVNGSTPLLSSVTA